MAERAHCFVDILNRKEVDKMTENDIIAMYVQEKYPELINTVDYSMFRLKATADEASRSGKEFNDMLRKGKGNKS